MEILVITVVITVIVIFIYQNRKTNDKNLKEIVKKTFPNHTIIEKFGTVMICEINHRNEPDELVFIRINANKKKNINKIGKYQLKSKHVFITKTL
ncbi:MAG: hypothetical protein VX125_02410 [Pseudomonadota bacterium]|nr:hypothetical protein [Pseudomonadota bacterium]